MATTQNLIEFPPPAAYWDSFKPAPRPFTIFSVGEDEEVLRRRAWEIACRSDLRVRSMLPGQAEAWARSSEAHIWMFCHTLEFSRLVYLACSVRRFSPGSRLLLLEGKHAPGYERSLFDEWLQKPDPDAVTEAVLRLATGL